MGMMSMIVYEYTKKGSLKGHLHGPPSSASSPVTMSWKTRIEILVGVSRAIEYLHSSQPPVIHRNIKPCNILLDSNWALHLSGFDLAVRYYGEAMHFTDQVNIKAMAYVDPEDMVWVDLKMDVYSFGVVMLEVLTGKGVLHRPSQEERMVRLVDLTLPLIEAGEIGRFLDRRPAAQSTPRQLKAVNLVARTAVGCVQGNREDRLAMSDVVANLQAALELVSCDGPTGEMELLELAANVAQLTGVDLSRLIRMVVWMVKTVCRNGDECCRQIEERAERLAGELRKLQESEMEDQLEEEWKSLEGKPSLRRAHELVAACQQGSNYLRRFCLRKDDLADQRKELDYYLQQLQLFQRYTVTNDEQTHLLNGTRHHVFNQDGAQLPEELPTSHSDRNASDAMAYTLLKDVTQNRHDWTVLVRLARLWEYADYADKSNVLHLDFVMVDKKGTAMEGTVPKYLLPQFSPLLKEGSVYYISKFEVADAKQKYRAVDAVLMARLTKFSIVEEVTPQPQDLPVYVYTATPFTTLPDRISKTDQQIAVCLWGSHANAFHVDGTHLTSNEGPTTILFVGMIVTTTQSGRLTLQSTSATKWYINVLIPEVRSLRASVGTQSHQLQWQENPVGRPDPIEASLTELVRVIPNDAIGTYYKVDIFIKDFVPNKPWSYLGCSSCSNRTFRDGDGYKCPSCSVRKAEPMTIPDTSAATLNILFPHFPYRYMITVQAIDRASINMPDAPVANFIFFNEIGQNLVGRPAALFIPDAGGQSTYIPTELKDLIGRRYTVIAKISPSSIQDEYLTFYVREAEEHNANLAMSTHPSVDEASTSVTNAAVSAPAVGGIGAATTMTPALLPNTELAGLTPSTSTLPGTEELYSPIEEAQARLLGTLFLLSKLTRQRIELPNAAFTHSLHLVTTQKRISLLCFVLYLYVLHSTYHPVSVIV
uniref:Protein kinase domain-containing protein n=1 Tax=Leersia perrieri TaxID=77586 RepID=A0A0D9XV47_9ORYZ